VANGYFDFTISKTIAEDFFPWDCLPFFGFEDLITILPPAAVKARTG